MPKARGGDDGLRGESNIMIGAVDRTIMEMSNRKALVNLA